MSHRPYAHVRKLRETPTRHVYNNYIIPYTYILLYIKIVPVVRLGWLAPARHRNIYNWGERERAPLLVHSQAGGVRIYIILCYIVRSSSPRINCSTLYATPVGPREIPERIRRKLYVYFTNTTSTFRISGIYR